MNFRIGGMSISSSLEMDWTMIINLYIPCIATGSGQFTVLELRFWVGINHYGHLNGHS